MIVIERNLRHMKLPEGLPKLLRCVMLITYLILTSSCGLAFLKSCGGASIIIYYNPNQFLTGDLGLCNEN